LLCNHTVIVPLPRALCIRVCRQILFSKHIQKSPHIVLFLPPRLHTHYLPRHFGSAETCLALQLRAALCSRGLRGLLKQCLRPQHVALLCTLAGTLQQRTSICSNNPGVSWSNNSSVSLSHFASVPRVRLALAGSFYVLTRAIRGKVQERTSEIGQVTCVNLKPTRHNLKKKCLGMFEPQARLRGSGEEGSSSTGCCI